MAARAVEGGSAPCLSPTCLINTPSPSIRSGRGSKALWGIDLGGTKIECIVLKSASNPEVFARSRIKTQGERGYLHVLRQISRLIDNVSDEVGFRPEKVGFGMPGSIDPDSGLLKGSNSQHLLDKPLHQDLEHLLDLPVAVENDANCFTLAETRMGSVASLESQPRVVFGIIMGTGVGGGLVIDQQLIRGPNGISGEWGHNYLDLSGGPCYCGKTGCVESVISGPALERFYFEQTGSRLGLARILHLAHQGDRIATATRDRLIHFFGLGVSNLINTIDPDVIVIGGGLSQIQALYHEGMEKASQLIFSPTMKTTVLRPALGDSAGVFGAAYLVA